MSEQIKDGGQAFPGFRTAGPLMQDGGPEWSAEVIPGMTLRDYFAAKALPEVYHDYATDLRKDLIDGFSIEEIADYAYRLADAMLAAREAKS